MNDGGNVLNWSTIRLFERLNKKFKIAFVADADTAQTHCELKEGLNKLIDIN